MDFIDYYKETEGKSRKSKKNWTTEFDFDVAFLISEARIKKGWTQAQLAKRVGTQQPSIARVEGGSSVPSLGFLKKIALAIGTTLIPPKFGFMEEKESSIQVIIEEKPYFVFVKLEDSDMQTTQSETDAYQLRKVTT